VASSATKTVWDGDLQIIVVDQNVSKGHIFDQAVLFAITCDSNNHLIILSYAIVTFETEDNWVWFRHQLKQDFPLPHVHVADYSKMVGSQQFQDVITTSR
jgi:hypothetical protein